LRTLTNYEGILYCPTTYLNFKPEKLVKVVSLHDVQEKRYPQNFSRDQRIYRDIRVKYTLNNSHKIQVSSHFMAVEVMATYGTQGDLFIEIPEGVDLQLFKPLGRSTQKKQLLPDLFKYIFQVNSYHTRIILSSFVE
jgi:hypothetical protein